MVTRQEKIFNDKYGRQRSIMAFEFVGQEWLRDVPKRVSYKALTLIRKQHQIALPAIPTKARPFPPSLPPYIGYHRT